MHAENIESQRGSGLCQATHDIDDAFWKLFVEQRDRALTNASIPRPDTSYLPEQYLSLLDQIESVGWASVNWKKGYTMLHWAASKGHGDLCRYLVQLGASTSLRDHRDNTPADLA